MSTGWSYRSAGEMALAIRSGNVSSAEIVSAHLEQIRRHNHRIHAIVNLRAKEALAEAKLADEKVKAGAPLGPLHGVPITIKDAFRVKGIRSTYGAAPEYLHSIPRSDCDQVRRLREAGAIVLGRTNIPFLALDWQCRSPFFPEGKNPWDLARTPGGSSGGSAAALAAGFTPLELGSDLGGSIRYPSHCCGVLGLRTSEGLLPNGDIGPEGAPQAFHHLLSCGPMSRSIPDIRLMLEILSGEKKKETPRRGKKLAICLTQSLLGVGVDSNTESALRELTESLRNDGHTVEHATPGDIDFDLAFALLGLIAGHEFQQVLPAFLKTYLGHKLFTGYLFGVKMGGGKFARWFSKGLRSSRSTYEAALEEKAALESQMDRFFREYDLWILPVSPSPAIRRQRFGFPLRLNGRRIPYASFLGSFLCPTVLAGTPALAFPIRSRSPLPIGIQAHGPRGSDFALLDMLEEHFGKYVDVRIPPGFSP
jgi:amidase